MESNEMTLKDEMELKTFTTVRLNNVPLKFWEEFKKDAEVNFSNNYIMKIMHDHLRRKEGVSEVEERLYELEVRLAELEQRVIGTSAEVEKKIVKSIHGFGRLVE